MNTTGIYVKTQPEIKEKAQRIAKDLGLSLSELINIWLVQLVETRRVDFSVEAYALSIKRDSSNRSASSE